MTEDAEVESELPPKPESEKPAPHFLRDVIFHGKFGVSSSTRHVWKVFEKKKKKTFESADSGPCDRCLYKVLCYWGLYCYCSTVDFYINWFNAALTQKHWKILQTTL